MIDTRTQPYQNNDLSGSFTASYETATSVLGKRYQPESNNPNTRQLMSQALMTDLSLPQRLRFCMKDALHDEWQLFL